MSTKPLAVILFPVGFPLCLAYWLVAIVVER